MKDFDKQLTMGERVAMANRFRAARYVAKLSLGEVADKAGVSRHSIQNYERGTVPRDPGLRAIVAEAVGLDELVLFAEYHAKMAEAEELVRADGGQDRAAS